MFCLADGSSLTNSADELGAVKVELFVLSSASQRSRSSDRRATGNTLANFEVVKNSKGDIIGQASAHPSLSSTVLHCAAENMSCPREVVMKRSGALLRKKSVFSSLLSLSFRNFQHVGTDCNFSCVGSDGIFTNLGTVHNFTHVCTGRKF